MNIQDRWVAWAMEIQSLAQAGLTYGKDSYDLERYQRLREIAAEMIAEKANISLEKAKTLFCNETGYQTPKVDTRAAVFAGDKLLLVREKNGVWALPGGWCDVNQTVRGGKHGQGNAGGSGTAGAAGAADRGAGPQSA